MNVRLSILLVVVLVLIGGAVFITRELSTKERVEVAPWLFQVNIEDISSISVNHNGTVMGYALVDGQWVIKDGNDTPVFLQKWAGTTLLLSGPRSTRGLPDPIDDPAKYGLDSPQTKVELIDRVGVPLIFHLGDVTPEGRNWYARLVGSDRLFIVASEWGEVISKLATEPPYPPTPTPAAEGAASAVPNTGDE